MNLPREINPKLSYFIGYLQGDGAIESNKKRIDFIDEYSDQIKQINTLSLELFNVKGKVIKTRGIKSKKYAHRLDIGSIVLNSYINKVFGVNRGIKSNLKIPEIMRSNKEIFKWYLRGLFDADGTLPKNPDKCKQYFIDITMKDRNFINEIKEALGSFGIETLKPYCRIAKSPNSEYISQ